jgi:hypothetical protein
VGEPEEYCSDYHHMSPDGAGRFTAMLATAIYRLTWPGPRTAARTASSMTEQMALVLHRAVAVEPK